MTVYCTSKYKNFSKTRKGNVQFSNQILYCDTLIITQNSLNSWWFPVIPSWETTLRPVNSRVKHKGKVKNKTVVLIRTTIIKSIHFNKKYIKLKWKMFTTLPAPHGPQNSGNLGQPGQPGLEKDWQHSFEIRTGINIWRNWRPRCVESSQESYNAVGCSSNRSENRNFSIKGRDVFI